MTYHLVNFVYLFTLMVFNVTDLKKKKKHAFLSFPFDCTPKATARLQPETLRTLPELIATFDILQQFLIPLCKT